MVSTRDEGNIQLVVGPVLSGKSSELLRRVRNRWYRKHQKCLLVAYRGDTRYKFSSSVTAHDLVEMKAISGDRLQVAERAAQAFPVIGIDDGHLFPDLVEFAERWANAGKVVIVAALDGTFQRQPFAVISQLIPLAEEVTKLWAVCTCCKREAAFTDHVGEDKNIEVVGGAVTYRAACRACHQSLMSVEHACTSAAATAGGPLPSAKQMPSPAAITAECNPKPAKQAASLPAVTADGALEMAKELSFSAFITAECALSLVKQVSSPAVVTAEDTLIPAQWGSSPATAEGTLTPVKQRSPSAAATAEGTIPVDKQVSSPAARTAEGTLTVARRKSSAAAVTAEGTLVSAILGSSSAAVTAEVTLPVDKQVSSPAAVTAEGTLTPVKQASSPALVTAEGTLLVNEQMSSPAPATAEATWTPATQAASSATGTAECPTQAGSRAKGRMPRPEAANKQRKALSKLVALAAERHDVRSGSRTSLQLDKRILQPWWLKPSAASAAAPAEGPAPASRKAKGRRAINKTAAEQREAHVKKDAPTAAAARDQEERRTITYSMELNNRCWKPWWLK